MRTTAILNLKGGVAKTVTTVNMAAILARDYKARVLLIDADCQCNCTEFFGGASDKGTLADILRLPDSYPDPVTFCANCIRGTTVDGVNLIPGDDSLMDLDLSKVELGRVTLIDIDNSMADRGYLNGDEVREDADRDPVGLTEYKVLENYIPYDMSGNQLKLAPKEDKTNA